MPNPFAKGWNYLKASLDQAVDDNADPKVQVHQAMTAAKEQHRAVAEQAAAVIGNARQLEIQMSTTGRRIDEVRGQVRQTLQAADAARTSGDAARATQLESQAEQLAAQLVSLEEQQENNRQLHGQAVQAAEQAKQAVAQSEQRLQATLGQRDQLLLQAEQAAMQERTVASAEQLSGPGGGDSPTFEEIRSKIESRYTTALGRQELAEAQGASSTAQLDAAALTRESEGRARLDQIRASMGLDSGSTPGATGELTGGQASPAEGGAAAGDAGAGNAAADDAVAETDGGDGVGNGPA